MSKKRKTRKQKETSVKRHGFQVSQVEDTGYYSISGIHTPKKEEEKEQKALSIDMSQREYLRKDIISITASTGIILAFDILLFVLLSTGVLHLSFLGY